MTLPPFIAARRLAKTLVILIAMVGVATVTATSVQAGVFRGILSATKPASPPFVRSPNFMNVGPSGATITFTITVTNLTTVPQTELLDFSVNHILTYYGLSVADGQPGQPGITFKATDPPNTKQQVVGVRQFVTVTFPPPSAGPTRLTFKQTVDMCGYFQVDVGQPETATLPRANLSGGFTRILGCQTLAQPTLTTTPHPASAIVGATLNDSAILSGGSSPTGKITFTLVGPNQVAAYTETVSVSHGNGTYSTLIGHVAGSAGTWHWQASYSGDANNQAIARAADEAVTVTKPTGGVLAATGSTSSPEILALALILVGMLAIVTSVAWRRRLA